MTDLVFTVSPGEKICLADVDPGYTAGFESKKAARERTAANLERLQELQERLYAQGKHALLVVLQAMDAGGKDGTIKHVLGAFNPQGVHVTPFKVPTEEEAAHDILWRVHKAVPRRGMVGIFNRSHYEEVLIVRVRELKPREVWSTHYEHINAFERLLAESGVAIVKLFLHISPEEQAERLQERLQRPDKHWKFNPADLEERKRWTGYMAAFEDALGRCSTEWAPWHIVPANRKWYRNLAVSEVLVDVLEGLDLRYPPACADIGSYTVPEIG